MGLSPRWVRKLLGRRREEGDGGIVHRLRGRRSNRRIEEQVRERVMAEVRQRYADFGPTLASERLAAEGMPVSRETLRKWMAEEGLWQVRKKRLRQVHVWRQRRAARGELVMMDSSRFRWLEERGPELYLIAMIDDATSRLWGRFVEHDSTEENLRTLGGWIERWGRPLSLYTDRNSLFVTTRPVQQAEQLQGQVTARTQFGRALYELGIGWIAAHSPQAKGRIERLFGTLQDRLVKADAAGRGVDGRRGQPVLGGGFPALVGATLHGGTPAAGGRAPRTGTGAAAGGDPERPGGAPGLQRLHGELAGHHLGPGARAGPARHARGAGGGGATVGRLGVAALPWLLSETNALPGAAAGNSFRPTASRTCRQ